MTKEEFIDAVNELEGEHIDDIYSGDYDVIEKVYTFHPALNYQSQDAKKQVASLYRMLGMSVFYDMLPTAQEAQACQERVASCRYLFEEAKKSYDAFLRKKGCLRE